MGEFGFISLLGYIAAEIAFRYFVGTFMANALWRLVFGADDLP